MWAKEQWEEVIGDSANWRIVPVSEEAKQQYDLDEDYTIEYVGPIIDDSTVERVPNVPLLYQTFHDLPELVHLPSGLKKYGCMNVIVNCPKFNPSLKELMVNFVNTAYSSWAALEPFKNAKSPHLIGYADFGDTASYILSTLFSLDYDLVHNRLISVLGKTVDNNMHLHGPRNWFIDDFLRSARFLTMCSALYDLIPEKTIKFTTGCVLDVRRVSRSSEMTYEAQRVSDKFALAGRYRPCAILQENCILYKLSDDFVIDNDDEELINAFGIKFNDLHLTNAYKAGNDATVEVSGDSSIISAGCPLQASGILTIKGSGTLTIECTESMQACIGTETHTGMSYGRWEPGIDKPLKNIIIDGVHVICKSKVENFSLGSYGESSQPVIEYLNGGSIDCPENNGYRIMVRSGAEGLCGSTKRECSAKYELQEFTSSANNTPKKMEI